jgi:hypothetical protein
MISSLFSLAVFNIFKSVGKVISAGVHVASTISFPLFFTPEDPVSPSLLSGPFPFDNFSASERALAAMISFTLSTVFLLIRFRK